MPSRPRREPAHRPCPRDRHGPRLVDRPPGRGDVGAGAAADRAGRRSARRRDVGDDGGPGRTAVAPSGPVEPTTTGAADTSHGRRTPSASSTDATTTTPPTTTPPPRARAPATPAAVVARPVPLGGPATPRRRVRRRRGRRHPRPAATSAPASGARPARRRRALDAFFRARIGPVIGHDYQHVFDLGGERRLWLFQDTFLDPTGNATRLDQASFAHNTAMVQNGACFTLLHRGTATAPASFEPGTGERTLSRWFWPLGGETAGGQLRVFWAEMAKTADPAVPDGLGWVPVGTWLATYDATSLARLDFQPAPDSGVDPIYGYAVSSDAEHTYLFGNTFDQNLARQGGYHACPCSATAMYAGPGAARPARRGAGVPDADRVDVRRRRRRADRPAVLGREPDAAPLPRRAVGRGDQGRRLLGRRPGDRRRRPAVGAVDDGRPVGRWRPRGGDPADEHLPRPPDALAERRPAGRQRVPERPRHAPRRLAAPRALPPAVPGHPAGHPTCGARAGRDHGRHRAGSPATDRSAGDHPATHGRDDDRRTDVGRDRLHRRDLDDGTDLRHDDHGGDDDDELDHRPTMDPCSAP